MTLTSVSCIYLLFRIWKSSVISLKVHFLDINVKEGKKVENEFENIYGKGMVKFVKCDVTNDQELHGKQTFTPIYSNYKQWHFFLS